jgi:hypothetical protein
MGGRATQRNTFAQVHDKNIFGHASLLHLKVFFRSEKEPETYSEDDLRAVRDYEDKVQFLNSERERYKTLLRGEYGKVSHSASGFVPDSRELEDQQAEAVPTHAQADAPSGTNDFVGGFRFRCGLL